MPEVLITALELNESLKGKYITEVSILTGRQRSFDKLYLPAKVNFVTYYGKRIVFYLTDYNGNEVKIGSFLGMEGHWGWDPNRKHMGLTFKIESCLSEAPLIYLTERSLYFDDTRHMGFNVVLEDNMAYDHFFKNLGMDLLVDKDKITAEVWRCKLRNKRIEEKQICDFLISPKYFSGIGNYLKSEILYRAKIKPDRCLKSLNDTEIETLRLISAQTITEAFTYGGLTIATFLSPNGSRGNFKCQVYMMEEDPLGNYVVRSTFKDGRTTHWVPSIQI